MLAAALEARGLVELLDRWLNPPEWVDGRLLRPPVGQFDPRHAGVHSDGAGRPHRVHGWTLVSAGNPGVMYANGEGVAQNDVLAHMWLTLAAFRSAGTTRERWAERCDDVAARLTSEALAEAQRRALDWQPGR